jgi:transposase, IS6 family
VIVLAPRWYLRFALSYRDVEELIAERGIQVDHVTIYRAVDQFGQVIVRIPNIGTQRQPPVL